MRYFLTVIFLVLAYQPTSQAALKVLTCEPEWQSLLEELAGEKVDSFSATTGLQDPHSIQARPSLIAKARQADLLVCTGADLEVGWLPLLLRKSNNPSIQPFSSGYFMATDQVLLMEKPQILDRSLGDIHAAGNPHVHLDPHRILEIAKALSVKLQTLDSTNQDFYQKRLSNFTERWSTAITEWEAKAKPLQGKNIISYHRSWIYFNHWLGLNLVATVEPKPGIPPSSGYLSRLIQVAKSDQVSVIFHAAYVSPKSARWLSNKTDLPLVSLPYTVGGNESVSNLFELFELSIDLLLEANQS